MKSRKEGHLLIDHRASPGISGEQLAAAGLGHMQPMPAGVAWESATVTCAICMAIVVLNPNRSRPRHYHPQTDSYICDDCANLARDNISIAPAAQALDYLQEQAFRKEAGMNPLPPLGVSSPLLKP